MNSTLMSVQSSLDFRASFEEKKSMSFVNANLTLKLIKAIRSVPILYRCHGVNIGATEFFSLPHWPDWFFAHSTSNQYVLDEGCFPRRERSLVGSCQALSSSTEIITRGGMDPLIHKHS